MRTMPVFSALFLLAFASGTQAETLACAHRGDVHSAPENTVPAFRSAVEKGAHMIEFDVATTKDGHLVIMHDSTLDRTTDGSGKVNEITFEAIRKLDAGTWFDARFKGTQVPTLQETLEVIPKSVLCNVHLKSGPGLAAKTAKTLQEMGRLDHCFLACSVEQRAEAKAVVPEIMICNMSRQSGNRRAYIDLTIELETEFIQLAYKQGTDNLEAEVKELHQHGVRVNWFGAQEEKPIRLLAEAGVDYILTDNLDLCLRVLADYGTKPLTIVKEK